ncbi:MAG: hypothetical protein ACE366_19000 [Bradymonadia bacterium]
MYAQSLFTKVTRGLVLAGCMVIPAIGGQAMAELGQANFEDAVPRVVPYDGYLNLDGAPYDGTVDVIFSLYTAASGGETVWTETWSTEEGRPVSVTSGRFAVALGSFERIEAAIADTSATYYLGMEIKLPEGDAYTTLGGRQRINPVPYAVWSAQSSNLTVEGVLHVEGEATINNNLNVTGAVNAGSGAFTGVLTAGSGTFSGALSVGSLDAGALNATSLTTTGDVTAGDDVIVADDITASSSDSSFITSNYRIRSRDGYVTQVNGEGNWVFAMRGADDYLGLDLYDSFPNGVRVGSTLLVDEGLTSSSTTNLNGTVNMSQCRICLNTSRNADRDNQDQERYACVEMTSNSVSPWVEWGNNIDEDDWFRLVFRCDGGGSTAGGNGSW